MSHYDAYLGRHRPDGQQEKLSEHALRLDQLNQRVRWLEQQRVRSVADGTPVRTPLREKFTDAEIETMIRIVGLAFGHAWEDLREHLQAPGQREVAQRAWITCLDEGEWEAAT
jgi:hypothetical protein